MTDALPLTIVVPVYHEQDCIAEALRRLRNEVPIHHRVLVVYDSDDDPTVPVVQALLPQHPGVALVRNDLGPGVVYALRAGLAAASESPGEGAVLVSMADLSDDLRAVEPMHRLLEQGYDVVAASRYMPGGEQHGGGLLKAGLSRLAGRSLAALAGFPTRDATNAFRMYRASFLRAVTIESTGGFEVALELTVKAWARGYRVTEVPSVWRDRTAGESKFQLKKWLPKYLRWYAAALGHRHLGLGV